MTASVSVVVLAYDDAPTLPRLVPQLRNVLSSLTPDFEILIVDDGSKDATPAVSAELAVLSSEVKLVRHEVNRGVGAAFRAGWQASTHDWVGYIDGDGQYEPADFVRLAAALSAGAQMASGLRVRRADPLLRSGASAVYNGLLRGIYGAPLRDTNSGIKLYTRDLLMAVSPLLSDGSFFDAEILIKSARSGYRIVEVPVTHRPRRHGRAMGLSASNVRDALTGLANDHWRDDMRPGVAARALRALAAQLVRVVP